MWFWRCISIWTWPHLCVTNLPPRPPRWRKVNTPGVPHLLWPAHQHYIQAGTCPFSTSPSDPNVNWCSISFSRFSLWAKMSVAVVRSCTRTHLQIHWECVTCSSCMINPEIHADAGCNEWQVRRCALLTLKNGLETIPIMKLSRPIVSWDIANYCKLRGGSRSVAQSRNQVKPHLWRYLRSNCWTSGCVVLLASHRIMLLVDW